MASKLWRTPTVVPALAYEDVPAAVEFLTRTFGFRERAGARLTGDGFVLAWMEVGDGLISLGTAGGHGRQSPRIAGTLTQSVKVYVDGIDRHFARAKAAGAFIISEPDDKFWGGRIYEARDIEGHYWEFSERDRELDSSAWKLPPGIKMGA
ncbi:VOC family protein [Candidatus Binatus sp.]|uniref:VOC family protein n=1 Tax=Candidatus Binatus sp. TaxID=2811406 RepID=UPI002F944B34